MGGLAEDRALERTAALTVRLFDCSTVRQLVRRGSGGAASSCTKACLRWRPNSAKARPRLISQSCGAGSGTGIERSVAPCQVAPRNCLQRTRSRPAWASNSALRRVDEGNGDLASQHQVEPGAGQHQHPGHEAHQHPRRLPSCASRPRCAGFGIEPGQDGLQAVRVRAPPLDSCGAWRRHGHVATWPRGRRVAFLALFADLLVACQPGLGPEISRRARPGRRPTGARSPRAHAPGCASAVPVQPLRSAQTASKRRAGGAPRRCWRRPRRRLR